MRLLRFGWRWGLLGRGSGRSFFPGPGIAPRATFASLGPNSQQPKPTANTNIQFIPTTAARRAAVAWWPSEAKARSVSKPLCMRRGAQGFADQGSQLFERSEFCETPRNPSTAGCPQRSGGSQTVGSPFFCLRFFGEAKKSRSPAGATPGLGKQRLGTVQKPRALTPTLSQGERE